MKQIKIISLLIFPLHVCWADITTDGTVGPALNLTGPNFQIDQTIGLRLGDNLFHSFRQFNLTNLESATFTGANSIQNVISRVTGGSVSSIDGLLKSEVGQADFYFVNPAGIFFGNNATIDVPAAFYASTAAELKFADGSSFKAANLQGSQFTIAEPDSFGFTSDQTGQISITANGLVFKPGTTVNFNSQSLNISQANIVGDGIQLQLIANGAQNQDISIQTLPNQSLQGAINIQQSTIDISGNGTEQLQIRGGITGIQDSVLLTNNVSSIDHITVPAIDVKVTELQLNNSVLASDVRGSGDAGNIVVSVDDTLEVLNSRGINSNTFSAGNAGSVNVTAARLLLDGQDRFTVIASVAQPGSTGNAGKVSVDSLGLLSVLRGGLIGSYTFGAGNADSVDISADEIVIDRQGSNALTSIISSSFSGTGNSGDLAINSTKLLSVLNGGQISSSTFTTGNAGTINISAGEILVDGQGNSFTGITSSAESNSQGNAGNVNVKSEGLLSVLAGGFISSNSRFFAAGDAGAVTLNANEILIDGEGAPDFFTGIFSFAFFGSQGNSGVITVNSEKMLSVVNTGIISTGTSTTGDAGTVVINSKGSTLVDSGFIVSDTFSSGNAGSVIVNNDGLLSILNAGQIRSSTFFGAGNAGQVIINAGELLINSLGRTDLLTGISSSAELNSQGNSGQVIVAIDRELSLLNGGVISSSTFNVNDAGIINVDAGSILIDGQDFEFLTGISSSAQPNSQGNAGLVSVKSEGLIKLVNGGEINSTSFGLGSAGTVLVNTDQLQIDGEFSKVSSSTVNAFSGEVGSIIIHADQNIELTNGGSLNITSASFSNQPDLFGSHEINITAPVITLSDGSQISAASTGNIAGSNIVINSYSLFLRNQSLINTSTSEGNGGSITLNSDNVVFLEDSQITTSVNGLSGNGGDINIFSPILVLKTGFIQANTIATNAFGGNINLSVDYLIPSNNNLIVGGDLPLPFIPGLAGYNVIQAVAPDGVNGVISNAAPELNITSALAILEEPQLNLEQLGQNPCSPSIRQNTLKSVGLGATTYFKKGQQLQTLEPLLNLLSDPELDVNSDSSVKEIDVLENQQTALTAPYSLSSLAADNSGCKKPDLLLPLSKESSWTM